MKQSVIILIPVYNDFASLDTLIRNLEKTLTSHKERSYSLLIVNDGSSDAFTIHPSRSFSIDILHLHRNSGHQKAIAIGLAHIHHTTSCDLILIMDGDGEDRPEDAFRLLQASDENRDKIVFAGRRTRFEGLKFRLFYFFYKLLFRWMTGRKISYGNFMLLPKDKLDKLVYHSEIWNHLSAAIIKSQLTFIAVPVDRGQRYAECSKMSFSSLVLHGLGAIAVFMERVVSRLLIFSFILTIISISIILIIIAIRYFTNLAIPGWASTILSSMLIVLLQGFLLSLFTIFLFLSSHSQRKFIPAHHYKEYMASIETIPHE